MSIRQEHERKLTIHDLGQVEDKHCNKVVIEKEGEIDEASPEIAPS